MLQTVKKILCVDDDIESCRFLEFLLGSSGEDFVVKSVHAANEAIELIEKESFQLYILDNWMLGFSGVHLCSLIRRTDKLTPILFYTAADRPAYRIEALNAGANEYLVKPDDLGRIEETVRRFLH